MTLKNVAVALVLLAGTSGALATPQESFDYVALNGSPLIGTGLIGAGNSVVSGTAVGAYTARSLTMNGNISAWGTGTWGSEARVQLTTAGGNVIVFGPFSTLNATPAGPISFTRQLNLTPQAAAGSWSVETYETYNDPGVDDATYDTLTLQLDDAAMPVGEPASFTDLGDFTLVGRTETQTISLASGNEVRWFKLKLPTVSGALPGYVDIWATPADPEAGVGPNELDDTDLALYNAASATLVTYDDLDGPGFFGQLSYGSTIARPATVITGQTAGAVFAGGDGALNEGFFYLAVGQYNMAHPADVTNNWASVASNYAGALTDTVLHIRTQLNTAPYPPTATGAAAPTTVLAGTPVVLTVTVTPGGNPASTGVMVHGDLSAMGGGSNVAFHDDGLNGDASAGDNVYSLSYLVPTTVTEGNAAVAITVSDAQSRSGTASIAVGLDTAGSLPANASVLVGSGPLAQIMGVLTNNDVDMYKINICDMASFSVTTGNSTPVSDTQLFLFNTDGTGVVMNDDNTSGVGLWSMIDNTTGFITADGDYYLAVSRYDIDPTSGGVDMWLDQPFGAQRQPDGAAAGGSVDGWAGVLAANSPYTLDMTGVCYPSSRGNICGAADLGGVGGVQGADDHLDNNDFVVFIDLFFTSNALADQGSTGGAAGPDGVWDNNDFVVFIDNFFNAPASCR